MTKHVEFKSIAAGPEFSAQPGQRKHVSDEMAEALIAGRHAELVSDAEAREDAIAASRETAGSPAARKRARR